MVHEKDLGNVRRKYRKAKVVQKYAYACVQSLALTSESLHMRCNNDRKQRNVKAAHHIYCSGMSVGGNAKKTLQIKRRILFSLYFR